MPERIGKGPILRKLDTRYQDIKQHGVRKQRLTNPATPNDDIADIGGKPDGGPAVLTPGDVVHIKRHWFKKSAGGSSPNPYWQSAEYVAEILKHGFITALTEAEHRHLPIETLWICSGSADYVSVYITWNTRQVNLIIDTPTLPGWGYGGAANVRENMWAVKRVRPNAPDPLDRPILNNTDPAKNDIILMSTADLGNPADGSMIVKRPIYMP
jgi:hypothetical protein